jgi:threonine synthase
MTGVFAEPAGAASFAGWKVAVEQNIISEDERALILNTGSGLKDIKGAMQSVQQKTPTPVKPTLAAVQELVKTFNLEP